MNILNGMPSLSVYRLNDETPNSRWLLQSLAALAGPDTIIYLGCDIEFNPDEVNAFLEWATEVWGFDVEKITEGIPTDYMISGAQIVKMRLRDQQKAQQAAAKAAAGTLKRKDEQ
jgi:hypothetical protein